MIEPYNKHEIHLELDANALVVPGNVHRYFERMATQVVHAIVRLPDPDNDPQLRLSLHVVLGHTMVWPQPDPEPADPIP